MGEYCNVYISLGQCLRTEPVQEIETTGRFENLSIMSGLVPHFRSLRRSA